ncbi:MAG: hypothetical protein MUC62_05890, partial [Candidatus Thermoplasmatota archaeon]|nr:hypothetical protein [Candidatus Thermoplasmatota archaeon]
MVCLQHEAFWTVIRTAYLSRKVPPEFTWGRRYGPLLILAFLSFVLMSPISGLAQDLSSTTLKKGSQEA